MRYNLTELKRYVTIIAILNIGPTILGETRDKSQILFVQRCNNAILIIQTCTTHSCSADAKLPPVVYATPFPSKEKKKKAQMMIQNSCCQVPTHSHVYMSVSELLCLLACSVRRRKKFSSEWGIDLKMRANSLYHMYALSSCPHPPLSLESPAS